MPFGIFHRLRFLVKLDRPRGDPEIKHFGPDVHAEVTGYHRRWAYMSQKKWITWLVTRDAVEQCCPRTSHSSALTTLVDVCEHCSFRHRRLATGRERTRLFLRFRQVGFVGLARDELFPSGSEKEESDDDNNESVIMTDDR